MISNLINNAVEAFEGKSCKVNIELKLKAKFVEIIIQDNGKGTKITLTFPEVETPDWIAEQIKINKGHTIVILDDDESIHHALEARFKPYKSDIELKHFTSGKEAINFINTAKTKDNIFLLSDFELINQNLNGLQVIEQTFMQQSSILVTSHYADKEVRDLAIKDGIKILPKQLASEVLIEIQGNNKNTPDNFKKVGLVIIDDDELLVDSLVDFFQNRGVVVDAYYKPNNFLDRLSQYPKNTKICMDNDFHCQITGVELAKQLHEAGYTQLYLFSGKDFEKNEIPSYLKIITKGDLVGLSKLV